MDSKERKRYIIEQRSAGRKITRIAEELGVTKQAVSLVWKDYEKRGEAIFTPRSKGRYKERDTLTAQERKQLVAWLKEHTPADVGSQEPRWTLKTTKRAALKLFDKRINLEKAHAVFHSDPEIAPGVSQVSDPRYRPPADDDAETEGRVAEDKVPAQEASGTARPEAAEEGEMPSLEEMRRKNEETLAKLPEGGKPRKGSPVTRSKKRKRKGRK